MHKFHVKVYKIIGKLEVDILATTSGEAEKLALETIQEKPFNKSDCEYFPVVTDIILDYTKEVQKHGNTRTIRGKD